MREHKGHEGHKDQTRVVCLATTGQVKSLDVQLVEDFSLSVTLKTLGGFSRHFLTVGF
jgi:hypothetical protein